MPPDFVFLASGSPRRRELLRQIGVRFRVLEARVDETPLAGEAPQDYVLRLAAAKAAAGRREACATPGGMDAPVLGADTAVVLEGRIIGKPEGREDAGRMLGELSGRTHTVMTAVALSGATGTGCRLSRSEVTFRAIDAAERSAYWDTGEPRDKAGGYAIQGFGAIFVAELRGSYSGVMGLPLFETAELLAAAGVARWGAP
jgi:septum formation protein